MTAGLKPYPAYRDIGLPWLPQVPEHWAMRRAKGVFRCIDKRSANGAEELLTVSSVRGVVPRNTANVTMFKAESYVGYKLCWPDDLVINSLWAWAGGLGVSRNHGIISSAYGVYRLRDRTLNSPAFVHELVRSVPFQWELQVRSKGIWTSRLQLTDQAFLEVPFPLPPTDEQVAIVRYIDHVDRKIRGYMRAKQKLIKLLAEQKQVIIHTAVTGQINVRTGRPYPDYKESGVEWIGKVPQCWDVRKLKRMAEVRIGLTYSPSDVCDEEGMLVLRASNIRNGHLVSADDVYVSKKVSKKLLVDEGDVLICVRSGSRSLVGKSARITRQFSGATYGAFMSLLRSEDNSFLYWVLNSNLLPTVMAQFETSTINQLTQSDLRNLPIPVPSSEERARIAESLDAKTVRIDASVASALREISLLSEYRMRVIADVVTGKLDVREAAANLSEETLESELLEDEDLIAESVEAGESAELEADLQEVEV